MKVSLKDLKKNKGERKEFSFLKSVKEILDKEYGELVKDFTADNYREALEESLKDYNITAAYITPEEIAVGEKPALFGGRVDKSKKKEKVEVTITSRLTKDPERFDQILLKKGPWLNTYYVKLEDFYVVSDEKAFEEYVLNILIKKEEEVIKETKKRAEEERDHLKLERERMKKYGKLYTGCTNDRKVIDIIEALEETNPEKKFNKLREWYETLMDTVQEIADDAVERNW